MNVTHPQALVVLAGSDPHSALTQAEELLQTATADDRPILLHAQGIAHRNLRNPEQSVARLRQSLDESGTMVSDIEWSIRADLAVSLGELGDHEAGLAELVGLEELDNLDLREGHGSSMAAPTIDPMVTAKCWHARGLLLQRMGRPDEAMGCYRRALPRYAEADAQLRIGQVNTNLGLLNAYEGDVEAALRHIDRADAAFDAANEPWWQAVSLANRGWILGCAGHLPKALQLMSESDRLLSALEMPDGLRVVSKAEVLLKGGLHRHARSELDRAISHFDDRGQVSDLSEALLLAAQAAALDGDLPDALSLVERARRELDRQSRPGWSAAARALEFGLQCRAGSAPEDLTAAVTGLLAELEAAGHQLLKTSVVLSAAWSHLDRNQPDAAQTMLDRVESERLSTEDVVLKARAEARLAEMNADSEAALLALDAAFTRLEADLGLLGGIDLAAQAAAAVAGVVAEAKRLLAGQEDGDRFLAWTDRGRQVATWRWPRLDDPELARLLSKARALVSGRGGALDDEQFHALEDIKQQIQELRWQQPAPESASGGGRFGSRQRTPEQVTSLIDITKVGDEWLVTTWKDGDDRSSTQRPMNIAPVQVNAALRLARLFQLAEPTTRKQLLTQLDQLLEPINHVIEEHLVGASSDLLLIGVDDELADLPWTALPALWSQPFSLLPTHRYLAERPTRVSGRAGTSVVIGPGLASEGAESSFVTKPGGDEVRLWAIEEFDDLAAALDNRVVHIAAHGGPEPENPLFTWLDLGCGRVFLHDLMFLDSVPETVLLAACYAGQAHRIGAGGTASFANGFLGVGSRWVVAAGTALVDDDELVAFAGAVLERVVDGTPPPVALADVRRNTVDDRGRAAAIAFTCYGGDGGQQHRAGG